MRTMGGDRFAIVTFATTMVENSTLLMPKATRTAKTKRLEKKLTAELILGLGS